MEYDKNILLNSQYGINISEETIEELDINRLVAYSDSPFLQYGGERKQQLVESIARYGVMYPIIVIPSHRGRYEIIAGNNRVDACKTLGINKIKGIVKENLNKDEIMSFVIDSNLCNRQISDMLPSELAKALRYKSDLLKRQGKRTDLTLDPMEPKLETNKKLGEEQGLCSSDVKRYIRLTYLIDELLDLVDKKCIGFRAGVDLSHISKENQKRISNVIESSDRPININMKQAKRLRDKFSLSDEIDEREIQNILQDKIAHKDENISVKWSQFNDIVPYQDRYRFKEIVKEALIMYYSH